MRVHSSIHFSNGKFFLLLDHTLFVLGQIALEEMKGVRLRRVVDVGVVEQVLHAKQNLGANTRVETARTARAASRHLFHSNRWLPVLLFVENAQTHRAAGIDVGMKKAGWKFACKQENDKRSRCIASGRLHFGGLLG